MTTEFEMANAPEQDNQATDIGRLLKAKRLSLNLDERQAATQLKISLEKVFALEENNYERFTSTTFVRGYIKSYCRILDLDHRPILSAFDVQQSNKESNIRPVDSVGKQTSAKDPIVYIVSGVVAAIVIFIAFWWPAYEQQDTQSSSNTVSEQSSLSSQESSPEQEPQIEDQDARDNVGAVDNELLAIDDSITPDELVLPESPNDDVVVTGLSAETIALLEDAGVDPQEVVNATREPEPQPEEVETVPLYKNDIEIQFSADCWTEVRDSTGKILFSGVKSSGSTLELNGEAPYQVVLGYSRGVEKFIYKGESFDFSSHVRKDLARFELE
ncbi:helix-turn-helix domain-containing protein [Marinomonas piezotolerans]|uniref:Helix-turn-helix domain-containing protein n=1 Tax=Marinomonas piezotolerans TaxID=2213058 RepID=A0A370U6L7_9GAMM|nr:RodZ family helix-turn-helix domain-containing protein [Marinomonas piezotolerans]RDL43403.1 helix-turn-helix domain-containing protein [Marinomonas piezotolerans]